MSPERLWISGAVLLTQDSTRRALRADLEIENGRIAAIVPATGSGGSGQQAPKGARVIDARGLVVAPGFVQAHVHLCQTLFRNQADDLELLDWLSKRIWPMEAAHSAKTMRTSARLGIHELLASGTTCILDMSSVRHTEAVLEAVRETGIRANVGKCLMDRADQCPPTLCENTTTALAEASALFTKWNGTEGDRIRISYAPRFVISCTEKLLREVARLSTAQGALVHIHASENRQEVELVRKLSGGAGNLEYLEKLGICGPRSVLAHCVWPDEGDIARLARTGAHVAHCPGSNLKLASGIAPIPEMRAHGVNVALGADGAPCNNSLDLFNEMRLAALIQKPAHGPRAMPAQEVLDMATRDGARALGWFDDIGSIEVGKKADLIALDLSSLENLSAAPDQADALASAIVYSTGPQHVRWTMVDGQTLFDGREVRGLPRADLLAEVIQARKEIASRLPA